MSDERPPITRKDLAIERDYHSRNGELVFKVGEMRVSRDEFHTVAMFVFNTLHEDRYEARAKNTWPKKEKKP